MTMVMDNRRQTIKKEVLIQQRLTEEGDIWNFDYSRNQVRFVVQGRYLSGDNFLMSKQAHQSRQDLNWQMMLLLPYSLGRVDCAV
jgi:hypothetical protein